MKPKKHKERERDDKRKRMLFVNDVHLTFVIIFFPWMVGFELIFKFYFSSLFKLFKCTCNLLTGKQ